MTSLFDSPKRPRLTPLESTNGSKVVRRPIVPPLGSVAIHFDVAYFGFGGTLNTQNLNAKVDGQFKAQWIWSQKDHAKSINYRESKEMPLLLSESTGNQIAMEVHHDLRLHVDNQAVVDIKHAFNLASRLMMGELQRLQLVSDMR